MGGVVVIFNVDPVPAPRQVRSDTWKPRPSVARYRAFRDRVRLIAGDWTPGDSLAVRFEIPMPKSWSKAKRERMIGQPHRQKPDIDNLVKAFLDCFGEDKAVWWLRAEKYWRVSGAIVVDVASTEDY